MWVVFSGCEIAMTFSRCILYTLSIAALASLNVTNASEHSEIRIVSSRPDLVTGGDTTVELAPNHSNWSTILNDRDVSSSFHRSKRTGKLTAVLRDLRKGENTLQLVTNGVLSSEIRIRNHPATGPLFSGPQQRPFTCQTEANGLGPPLDPDCRAKTLVHYYYKSIAPVQLSARDMLIATYDAVLSPTPTTPAPGFKLLDPSRPHPSDVAQARMRDGKLVDYIVRREIGVINRAVYEILFLHDPRGPLPTPWSLPTQGWNGSLVYTFDGGCGAGFHQGILPVFGAANFEPILAQGYALATSSLNASRNNCNAEISAETASMVKEHFVEQYGEPTNTIGVGCSGGSMSAYLISQNHPGILDGIIACRSVPDIVTTVIPMYSDCALLHHALKRSKHSWSEVQKTALSGLATWHACSTEAVYKYLDPRSCDSSIPKSMIYDPTLNRKGVRCTYFDNSANLFGRDPRTGFARRTLDNVGVQYGLLALNTGTIEAEQFIELNELMGGFDEDGKIVPTRTTADLEAIRAAYERGALLDGKNLSTVPIIDWSPYADDLGDIHTRDRAFITRSRLIDAHGSAENQAILVTPRPIYEGLALIVSAPTVMSQLHSLVSDMERWLANTSADKRVAPLATKIVLNKPASLADGCIATDGERIVELATYNGPGRCNQLYPSHGNPRTAAGARLASSAMKCALKPVDPSDYVQPFTQDQLERIKRIFSGGVCNYGEPGIGQKPGLKGRTHPVTLDTQAIALTRTSALRQ